MLQEQQRVEELKEIRGDLVSAQHQPYREQGFNSCFRVGTC